MQGIESLDYTIQSKIPIPEGGLQTIKNAANMLADFGREGDVYIVHAAEGETVVPMEVLNSSPRLKNMLFKQMEELGLEPDRYVVGNKLNSINPVTGQPEFFLKKIARAVKRVAKVAKKVAPIVLPIAAPFLLPAMPVAFATGLGSLAGNLISGRSFKDSLKTAVIQGGLAGLGNVAFGNMSGPGGGFGQGSFFGSRVNPTAAFGDVSFKQAFTPVGFGTPQASITTQKYSDFANQANQNVSAGTGGTGGTGGITDAKYSDFATTGGDAANVVDPSKIVDPNNINQIGQDKSFFQKYIYDASPNTVKVGADGQLVTEGQGTLESIFSPNRVQIQPEYKQLDAGLKAAQSEQKLAQAFGAPSPSAEQSLKTAIDVAKATPAVDPSLLAQYTPAAAGIATIGGGMYYLQGDEEPTDNDGDGVVDGFTTAGGEQLLIENPEKYGFTAESFYGRNPAYQSRIRTVADGGEITGPGTPTSDSIPAMLSDGEFVMNAKAVRGAGGGNRVEGAKRMYAMMRDFEKRSA
jgi:hypothetical protein